ncbi:hypothetical protein [Sphingomonas bacterium]|uniref:hypothetical protein n=1 Tax=Sphingomonas bacterium TaxID=1895847 RepID=UPI00262D5844|nr:hypothetical protein [Sphingomonas bacterium]MDB5678249.1 hypothetical protein [Sphingomonas bacterium]
MRFTIMALAGVMLAGPAIAQTADSTAPTPKPKKEKKICRADAAMTGSYMVRTTCRTQAEWAKIDQSGTGGVSGSMSGRSSSDPGTIGGSVR